jgi:hypothetical protein
MTNLLALHLDGGSSEQDRSASHVHRVPVVGVAAQLCPCGIATSTPQTFLVASPPPSSHDKGVTRHRRMCTADRPLSTRFEPAYLLRGFNRWFLTCTFPSR